MIQRTLSIIKPDAIAKDNIGAIMAIFEQNGLYPVAMKMIHQDDVLAGGFYAEHKGKFFYDNLVNIMSAGPVIVQVLEGENAIEKNRNLMGDKDPKKAEKGTIRELFGESIDKNSVHGSDSEESALREIAYYFTDDEICPRTI
jgi:nucleoside-diphosphate kinase